MSRALEDWAYGRLVQAHFIRPGKPLEDAFIEAFNRRLLDERPNRHHTSLEDAQIAAIARAGRLTLATRYTKEFGDIDDGAVVNP